MVLPEVVEEIKTHILCLSTFSESRAVYETMWKNTSERGRPQMTIYQGLQMHTQTG